MIIAMIKMPATRTAIIIAIEQSAKIALMSWETAFNAFSKSSIIALNSSIFTYLTQHEVSLVDKLTNSLNTCYTCITSMYSVYSVYSVVALYHISTKGLGDCQQKPTPIRLEQLPYCFQAQGSFSVSI